MQNEEQIQNLTFFLSPNQHVAYTEHFVELLFAAPMDSISLQALVAATV